MDIDTIRKCEEYQFILRDTKHILNEIERLNEKKETLRQSVILPGMRLDGMPHAHNNTDPMAGYIASLEPITQEIEENQTKLLEKTTQSLIIRRELLEKFNLLNETKAEVLKQRYLDGDGTFILFSTIADNLNYSVRYIRKLHKEAIEELSNIF